MSVRARSPTLPMATGGQALLGSRPGANAGSVDIRPASRDPAARIPVGAHRATGSHTLTASRAPERVNPLMGSVSTPQARGSVEAKEASASDQSQAIARLSRLNQLSSTTASMSQPSSDIKDRIGSSWGQVSVPQGVPQGEVGRNAMSPLSGSALPFESSPVNKIQDLIKQTAQSNEQMRLQQPMTFMQLSASGKTPASFESSINARSALGEKSIGSSEFDAQSDARSVCGIPLEDRVSRLEKNLDSLHTKGAEQAMNASVALSRAVEERLVQQLIEMRKELWQALQSAIGQEVNTIRFEMAGQAVSSLGSISEVEAMSNSGQFSPLIGIISDCVVERVKDQVAQHTNGQSNVDGLDLRTQIQMEVGEAVKLEKGRIQASQEELNQTVQKTLEELRGFGDIKDIKDRRPSITGSAVDVENLQNMVKETLKISDYLAKELAREREQRNRDQMVASTRLDGIEEAITQGGGGQNLQGSAMVRGLSAPKGRVGPSPVQARSEMGRAMSLQNRLSSQPPTSPSDNRMGRKGGYASPSPAKTSEDWGKEVAALRARLETIFHVEQTSNR